MTKKQRLARNEAYQLLSIAHRILEEAGLVAYAEKVSATRASMEIDAQMLAQQEIRRRTA